MATLNAKVFKHHYKKTDGTYNVKIVLYHGTKVYIDTEHYVVPAQLTKTLKIRDQFILAQLETTMGRYRKQISDLGEKLKTLSAESLKRHLVGKDVKIDFLQFSGAYVAELKSNTDTEKTGANLNTVRNHLIDFNHHREELPIEYVTVDFIGRFEKFLRSERNMVRKDRLGRTCKSVGKPLPDASVHVYLRDFQCLYSAAMKKYNQPSLELVPIKHNPFGEYDIVEAPESEDRNLEPEQLIAVRDCEVLPGSRAELARNMAMLSFYLCGMNAKDFHKGDYVIRKGRIEYCRSKTSGRRKDKAFISISIPEEALPLLNFVSDIKSRYATIGNLNAALSKGMAVLSATTGIPGLEFYQFRHSFGDFASNKCRKATREVALALNHVEQGFKSTNVYIPKDWSIVDEVQRAVLAIIKPCVCVEYKQPDIRVRNILFNVQLPVLGPALAS